jgi:hypothetical protein
VKWKSGNLEIGNQNPEIGICKGRRRGRGRGRGEQRKVGRNEWNGMNEWNE